MRLVVPVIAAMAIGAALTSSVPTADAPTPVRVADVVLRPAELSLIGTIERFEAVSRRLVLATKQGRVAFKLAAAVVVRLGSHTLPISALAAHRGRRCKVRYTDHDGEHLAHWVVISSEAPATPR